VEEGLDVAVDDSYRSAHLPALFRRIIQPSLDALAAHYWADPSNTQRYPVTLAVLQELQQQRLQLLPHLSTLTGFEAAFRARWSGTLSRDEAASVPLLTLLKSASAMAPGSSASCSTPVTTAAVAGPRQPAAELSVEGGRQFLTAWNAVAGITTRHECREVQVPTLKPQAAPAAMACVSSQDNGRLLAALLAELAGRQNAFLAVASGRQQQVGSTQQLPLQQEAGLSSKPVQLTQPGDVVDVPAAFQQLQELLFKASVQPPPEHTANSLARQHQHYSCRGSVPHQAIIVLVQDAHGAPGWCCSHTACCRRATSAQQDLPCRRQDLCW